MSKTTEEQVSEAHERGYIEGHRQAWTGLLQQAIHELRGDGAGLDPLVRIAALIRELEETRAVLRRACEDFGDNEWPDNLWLADALDKHLVRHLEAE